MLKTKINGRHFIRQPIGVNHSHKAIKLFSFHSVSLNDFSDQEKMIRVLVELGANLNAEDEEKRTPLHLAANWGKPFTYFHSFFLFFNVFITFTGHAKIVRVLIELGAKLDAKNDYNHTPRQAAESRGEISSFHIECKEKLLNCYDFFFQFRKNDRGSNSEGR